MTPRWREQDSNHRSLRQPETVEPGSDVHVRLPAAGPYRTPNYQWARILSVACRGPRSRGTSRSDGRVIGALVAERYAEQEC
jgi:hypothetical protein